MRVILSWICGLALITTGCGGESGSGSGRSAESKIQDALGDVGEMYRVYTVSKNKPPGTLADLSPFSTVGPSGLKAIKSGDIVVRYGATMTDLEEGPASSSSDKVLAYEKKAPDSGGEVLMLDRTIRTMTPEEFKAAPKAGKG